MAISASDVQQLRELTGAGMMSAKKALEEAHGDIEQATALLRKKGETKASERSSRDAHEGVVASYVHGNGKLASLAVIRCETDFVARTPEFQELAHDIAMHVSASNPLYTNTDEVPPEVLDKERDILLEQLAEEGVPENVREKALEGKIQKYYEEVCLMNQPFVKNPDVTIQDLITETAAKTGENIQIDRFVRFSL